MYELTDRVRFLNLAALFEGSLIGVAFIVGWVSGMNPLQSFHWEWSAAAWGVGTAILLFLLFLLSQRYAAGPLLRIKQFLTEMLGPPLSACRWFDLVLLSILVAFSEELLFRGALQPWLERLWGLIPGLLACSVLFGLAHFITPTYALLATLTGVYLGWLLGIHEERNLLGPIVAHGVYDYLAFLVVIRTYRQQAEPIRDPDGGSESTDEPVQETDPD